MSSEHLGARPANSRRPSNTPELELKLSFEELTLIYKSLLAAKSLGVLSQEDELVDDTIQRVDQALDGAARR